MLVSGESALPAVCWVLPDDVGASSSACATSASPRPMRGAGSARVNSAAERSLCSACVSISRLTDTSCAVQYTHTMHTLTQRTPDPHTGRKTVHQVKPHAVCMEQRHTCMNSAAWVRPTPQLVRSPGKSSPVQTCHQTTYTMNHA